MWAVTSPPLRNGYYQVRAYIWLHPDGRAVMRYSTPGPASWWVPPPQWEYDPPVLRVFESAEAADHFQVVSVSVTREYGQRLFFEGIAGPWEFIIADTTQPC